MVGSPKREWKYVCTGPIQFIVQQKLTRHWKATIAQFKKQEKKKRKNWLEKGLLGMVLAGHYNGINDLGLEDSTTAACPLADFQ